MPLKYDPPPIEMGIAGYSIQYTTTQMALAVSPSIHHLGG
jgi:hypothetical protein